MNENTWCICVESLDVIIESSHCYIAMYFVCIVDALCYIVVYGLYLIGCQMDQSAVSSGHSWVKVGCPILNTAQDYSI